MKIICKEVATLTQCYMLAHNHIVNCLRNNYSGINDLDNDAKIKNRIVDYAVTHYVTANFYTEYTIECEHVAIHHGKPIGTVIKQPLGLGHMASKAMNMQVLARITRNIKTIADQNFKPIMLSI